MKQKKRANKKYLSLIFYVVATLVGVTIFLKQISNNTMPVGSEAPVQSNFMLISGESQTISAYMTRPLLINFWATWCPPCRHELPALESVSKKFAQQINFLGLALESSMPEIIKLTSTLGISYPIGQIADQARSNWQINYLPTTYIIDQQGIIRWAKSGMITESILIKAIKNFLSQNQENN